MFRGQRAHLLILQQRRSNIIFEGQNNSLSVSVSLLPASLAFFLSSLSWLRKCGTINFGANKGAWLVGWLAAFPLFPISSTSLIQVARREIKEKKLPNCTSCKCQYYSMTAKVYFPMTPVCSHPHHVRMYVQTHRISLNIAIPDCSET